MTNSGKWLIILPLYLLLGVFLSPAACAAAAPKDAVIAAHQKLLALKSYRMTVAAATAFTLQGKAMNILAKSEIDVQANPLLVKNVITTALDGAAGKKEEKTIQYLEKSGGEIVVYSQTDNQWLKKTLPQADPLAEYVNYFKSIKSAALLKETKAEKLYEVVIDAASLKENLERVVASAAKAIVLPPGLLKDLGDFKYTLTINKKTGNIAGFDYDLSTLLAAVSASIVDSLDAPAEAKSAIKDMLKSMKVTAAVRISQPNAVGKIVIPPEALKAPQKSAVIPAAPKGTGFVDIKKLMAESPFVKARQQLLDQKGRELADRLNKEKAGLTEDQFNQKQNQYQEEYYKLQQKYQKEILESLQQAVTQVKEAKNLAAFQYKNDPSDPIPAGSIDITDDVIDKMK